MSDGGVLFLVLVNVRGGRNYPETSCLLRRRTVTQFEWETEVQKFAILLR
jgi:hypothetical protein